MELKAYLRILQRRWPIIMIVPLLVGVLAVYQDMSRDEQYTTSIRAIVRRMPDEQPVASAPNGAADPGEYQYDGYYNNLSSEFFIDDLVLALRGNVFAEGVAEEARESGRDISAGEVQGAIAVERQDRVLIMNIRTPDPARTAVIADATAEELSEAAADYLGATAIGSQVAVNLVDRPGAPGPDTSRARLLLLMEIMAAIGAGVLLAFLIDYLDDTLYDGESAAYAMRLPHLVSVPVERRA